MIPSAFDTLELDCAWMFSGSRFMGTGILLAGMVLDNLVSYPDMWFEKGGGTSSPRLLQSQRDVLQWHAAWRMDLHVARALACGGAA